MGFFSRIFNFNEFNDYYRQGQRNNKIRANKNSNFRSEFSTEIAGEVESGFIEEYKSYLENGIQLFMENENTFRVVYSGLLPKSGADEVYAVVSYGNNFMWEDIQYYKMNNIGNGKFELHLPVVKGQNINIAFKDSASNWDNNTNMNYSFSN